MKIQNLLLSLIVAGVLGSLAPSVVVRADAPKSAAKPTLCAVKGEVIADVAKAAGKANFKGKTLYFCCSGCATKFNASDDAGKARFARLTDLRTEKIVLQKQLETVNAALSKAEASEKTSAAPAKTPKAALYCAITDEEIASEAEAGGKAVFNGKTYYFCCGGCIAKFQSNPAKFAALADAVAAKRAAK